MLNHYINNNNTYFYFTSIEYIYYIYHTSTNYK